MVRAQRTWLPRASPLGRDCVPIFIEFAAPSAMISWFSAWRKHAEVELQRAPSELQDRVEDRTTELKLANERLRAETAERERAEQAYRECLGLHLLGGSNPQSFQCLVIFARIARYRSIPALLKQCSSQSTRTKQSIYGHCGAKIALPIARPPDRERLSRFHNHD